MELKVRLQTHDKSAGGAFQKYKLPSINRIREKKPSVYYAK
jgi:hypothetical protein